MYFLKYGDDDGARNECKRRAACTFPRSHDFLYNYRDGSKEIRGENCLWENKNYMNNNRDNYLVKLEGIEMDLYGIHVTIKSKQINITLLKLTRLAELRKTDCN